MKNLLTFILFAHLSLTHLYAQNFGTISGTIYDAENGDVLIGVNVLIEGTSKGTATDLDGRFQISGLEPGIYTLKVSYISFRQQMITDINVRESEDVELDIILQPETELLDEVVITAEAILSSEAGLLRHRQKAIAFSDAISSEQISKAGAGDAAAAMKKVAGASVVGGKYVFIRGLGDRYTSTHLNGMELPTSNPDKKSFQLDLLPANLLENIVTIKTFTPDKPGNFSGGLVDVNTIGIPVDFFLSVSAKQGYNTMTSNSNILLGDRSKYDWTGLDYDAYRSVPDVVASMENSEFPNAVQARFDEQAAQDLDQIANEFNSSFLPAYSNVGLNQSYAISFGNFHEFNESIKMGYTLSYSYGMSYNSYENGKNSRYKLLGQYSEAETLSPNLDLRDIKGSQNVDWGLLSSIGFVLGKTNRLNFSYLQTQSGQNTGRYLYGFWEQFNSDDIEYRSRVNQYNERDLNSYQFSGKHTLPHLNNIQIDWKTALQKNGQNTPDLRFIASEARYFYDEEGNITDTLLGNPRSQFPRPARLFRNLNETKGTATLDVTVPIVLPEQTFSFKMGGLYESTSRNFAERRYEYQQGQDFDMNQFNSEEAYLNQLGILRYDSDNNPIVGNYIVAATTDRSSYDAAQDIFALYGMLDFELLKKLKVATGVRYEVTDLQTISRDTTLIEADRYGSINQADLLPSLVLIYSINDKMNLRAAATKTLARPTFRELAPYVSFDFVGDNLFRGNAKLERTLISNYDLRWEWYVSPDEMFSVSAFYKDLHKPIERVLRFDIAEKAESVQNVDRGMVRGIELEARKNLGSLAGWLEHFQLMANLSFVDSEVNIPEQELILIRETQQNPSKTRPLTGQSPYIINLDLSYANPKAGLNSNISFNKFGDRLSRVSQGSAPDIFERSFSSLNYNIHKSKGDNFSVSLSISNILNPEVTYSQIFKGKEYIYQQYQKGRTISFGVKYDF